MRKEALVAVLLGMTILATSGFAFVYAFDPQTQLAAAFLFVAFGTLAAAIVVWEHHVMPRRESVEDRDPLPSGEAKDVAAADAFSGGLREVVGGRSWFVKLFAGAVGVLGVALLFPLRSLAPATANIDEFNRTSWRKGARLVRADGSLVRADDIEINSVVTVFPEGHVGPTFANSMVNDATVLIRVPPQELRLPADRLGWAPDGLIALSKVCTHAGCPVGLYRAAARQLFCPCHQSTFDVLRGGKRIFGPAARGLPQLPIAIEGDGTLAAQGDFPQPIGPGYWERA